MTRFIRAARIVRPPRKIRPRQIGWQVFEHIGTQAHETAAGYNIRLVCFRSHCSDCGAVFEALATQTLWKRKELSRRCAQHRSQGRPVNNLVPPVPLAWLPVWARPDTKAVQSSLGKRQPNCPGFPPKSKLRLIDPHAYERMLRASDVRTFGEARAAKFAERRAWDRQRFGLRRLSVPAVKVAAPPTRSAPPAARTRPGALSFLD